MNCKNSKRLLFLALLLVFTGSSVIAQITYNFTAITASGLPANVTNATGVTQANNNGTTTFLAAGTPASSGYTGATGGNNGNCSAKTGVLNTGTSTYIQVILTPAANRWVSFTAIRWGNYSVSTTGPTTLSVRTSLDNYATDVASTTVTQNSTWTHINNLSFSPVKGLTATALTIRIYAYGGSGTTPAAGTANWRVDDLVITAVAENGTAGTIPKYSTISAFTNSVITESATGNIGIGNATPAAKLDINGQIKISGGSPGLNKVLTSDATGLATWQTPAGGGGASQWTTAVNDVFNNNTGNVVINTNITSPGTGAGSEHFGNNSSTGTAINATAIGNAAVANANGAVAIGKSITAAYSGSVGIGNNAVPSASNSVAIGTQISSVGTVGIGLNLSGAALNIGSNNTAAAANYTSMLIGSGLVATAPHELRIGSGNAGWWPTQIYLSGASENSLASAYGPQTFNAISGLGTDIAGQGMRFKAGKSTGSAAGGNISFYTTPAGTAGTTLNTEVERLRIDANGAIAFNGSVGASGQVLTSGGAGAVPVWANAGGGGIATGSNGLTAASSNIKLGGDLINDTKIDVKNNWLWLKTPFKANEDTNKTGQVIIGDTNNVQKWNFPGGTNTLYDHQKNAALIISKTKYNNNENVDFLSLTTADAPSKNGWVFMNYTNAAGIVRPRLETYSLDGIGYEHQLYTKGNTETAFILNIADYDSLNLAANLYKPISDNSSLFALNNGGVNKFVVKGNGNVGIGTSTPRVKLDVLGTLIAGGDHTAYSILQTDNNNYPSINTNINSLVIGAAGNPGIIINPSGSVVIGSTNTTDANYKLFVETGIRTRKVKVDQTTWPDYVFDKKYPLLSLSELEKFITANKHLPEVPTAYDVKKSGIDLGDNQKILLQKIEELTLYIIEQNKKIELLQQEKTKTQSLQQQIDEIKKLMLNK